MLYLVVADLDGDPMAAFRLAYDAKTALRMLNRAETDLYRYRQHLINELRRMRAGYYKIVDAGGQKDPNTEVLEYLQTIEKLDSHTYNEMAVLDRLPDIFANELRCVLSELRLVNTPLNSSVASLSNSRMDQWIDEKRNEPRQQKQPDKDGFVSRLTSDTDEADKLPESVVGETVSMEAEKSFQVPADEQVYAAEWQPRGSENSTKLADRVGSRAEKQAVVATVADAYKTSAEQYALQTAIQIQCTEHAGAELQRATQSTQNIFTAPQSTPQQTQEYEH